MVNGCAKSVCSPPKTCRMAPSCKLFQQTQTKTPPCRLCRCEHLEITASRVAEKRRALLWVGNYLIDPLLEPLQLAVADKFVPPEFHCDSLVGDIGEDAFRKLGELVFRQEDRLQAFCATAKQVPAFAFKVMKFFKQRIASRTRFFPTVPVMK